MLAQLAGAVGGVGLANLMFQEPIFALSRRPRGGWLLIVSEFVATFGLVLVLWGFLRKRASGVPYAVAAYISAAYWFTPSTSFANPAATLARALTDTFAGIRPVDVPGFIVAECFGAAAATFLFAWLAPTVPAAAVERGVSTPRRGESHGPRDIRLPS
jgi:glycerol uptake facilitator-like aquaporin